ncbi:Tol-Pal system protein TolB [Anaerolineae bacterium]|nr:Tol-Pal system protein TolB [Anaerolineae bacterium]
MNILQRLIGDRFDRAVMGVIAALLGALMVVLAVGDQAGVGVLENSPADQAGEARVTSPIRIQFSERMNPESVESHFRIDPPMSGRFSWVGAVLTFYPERAWSLGVRYTITLSAGAQAQQGRQLKESVRWTFSPAPPRVVYLAPANLSPDSEAPNLWLVDPQAPDQPRQLTRTTLGVTDYQPSPDGSRIVYVLNGTRGTSDLYVLQVQSGAVQPITNCGAVEARCLAPRWSPDGFRIVYERRELNPGLPEEDRDVPRAWIVNLRDLSTAPLLANPLLLGAAPEWSPDGTKIAVFDLNRGEIVIYDLVTTAVQNIPTQEGESGMYTFAPDSAHFVFPELLVFPGRFTTTLSMVDVTDPERGVIKLSGADTPPVEDAQPAWHPDGTRLAFTRRWLDGSGALNAQVYEFALETGTIRLLVDAPEYIHGAISWSPAGDKLVMQRFSPTGTEAVPSIWVLDAATGQVSPIAKDAYLPRWLP